MEAMPPTLVSCDLHCLALEVVVCVPKTSSVFKEKSDSFRTVENFDQWLFLVPLIGGRDYIMP